MEERVLEIVYLELKYCERCGGLWLRTRGTGEVHCAPCRTQLWEFPIPPGKTSRPRLPNPGIETVDETGDLLMLVHNKGGNA
jgi:hypothetical protein